MKSVSEKRVKRSVHGCVRTAEFTGKPHHPVDGFLDSHVKKGAPERGFGVIELDRRDSLSSPDETGNSLLLTLVDENDAHILRNNGIALLRRLRIYRLTNEAERQGCLLSYQDLYSLLLVSLSTLKRDIALLRKEGYRVPMKGNKEGRTKG